MSDSYKILLVDDEKDILEFLSYNLRKESFTVRTALNGELAIEEAKIFKPDLIIMDVMMPEMDGVTACANIREIVDLKDVLILFLTARSEEYSELAGFDAGADDYVTKPIKPKLLISRIKALLKRNKKKERENSIIIGDIEVDKSKHLLLFKKRRASFSKKRV